MEKAPSQEMTENKQSSQAEKTPNFVINLGIVCAIIVMVAMMYGALVYSYPNGKPLGLVGFVMLWLREILLDGAVGAGVLVCLIAWLFRLCRKWLGGAGSE
ncbi:MAG: hypothetical protein V4447_07585 [Pseudomonadota bacterium]